MKSSLVTILGVAGLSLLKKVSGSKNHEKPFTFTMTFYLEGLNECQYNKTILNKEWLESVRGFIKGTNDFLRYGDLEDTPQQMILEYREYLNESIPTYIGEFIDQWLTGYNYAGDDQWENHVNTVEDIVVQWALPDDIQILNNHGSENQDQVMFTYHLSLNEIMKLSRLGDTKKVLKEAIALSLMINIEDWINVIAYYWRPNIEDCEFFIIEECELFVTDKKLEVDVSLIDSSQRKLVEALMKEQASSQLRKF